MSTLSTVESLNTRLSGISSCRAVGCGDDPSPASSAASRRSHSGVPGWQFV
jgi:hypothetical protein